MSHTPGPWTWNEDDKNYLVLGTPDVTVLDLGEDGFMNHADDARLIAAAPDLLEALRTLVPAFSLVEKFGTEKDIAEVQAARAAIAKATGGGE